MNIQLHCDHCEKAIGPWTVHDQRRHGGIRLSLGWGEVSVDDANLAFCDWQCVMRWAEKRSLEG